MSRAEPPCVVTGKIFEILFAKFGPQNWWPGETPWEVCTGAVLTQNTNWTNVEKAIRNLKKADSLDAAAISRMENDELAALIRPAGYFNVKARRLKAVAEWWLENTVEGRVRATDIRLPELRDSLLAVNGVGPETADSILLYSFGLPTFVIDAYTRRIMSRHFGMPEDIEYEELRHFFMSSLPASPALFNEFHALFVRLAKTACRKNECLPDCPFH